MSTTRTTSFQTTDQTSGPRGQICKWDGSGSWSQGQSLSMHVMSRSQCASNKPLYLRQTPSALRTKGWYTEYLLRTYCAAQHRFGKEGCRVGEAAGSFLLVSRLVAWFLNSPRRCQNQFLWHWSQIQQRQRRYQAYFKNKTIRFYQ